MGGLDRPFIEGLPAVGQRGPDDVGNARKAFSMYRLADSSFLDRDVALAEKRVQAHTGDETRPDAQCALR